ncbi:hypothetical protein SELMODRAFT_440915 [Selaginella moellendorffii]|uniref:Uncharacterized protein n=1 Tax=Selaginella moellendorffii TaxID=88036 RepID=D8RFC8_SELML|nr:uncharacterized protein LOC9645937 [Selaginella moellendorffii]EFJ28847.1 hypothetical protein SELMODRAFT_440915 [Selaginella moellendorffii]|eukprot:XP_002969723.1 uncharacterized protein LOC9645937 [Selaginella moellendorffii]
MSLFNAGVYAAASAITVFLVFAGKIAAISLFGSHAYLLPDDPADGNPGSRAGSDDNRKSSRKKNSREKFVWNEGGSEILRVTIGDSYLENTRYYPEYDRAVLYAALPVSLLVAREFFSFQSSGSENGGSSSSNSSDGFIPVIATTFCVLKLLHTLSKVSWDKHSSRNSEWVLSCGVGLLGFILASIFLFVVPSEIIDFRLEQAVAGAGIDKRSFTAIRLAIAFGAAWLTGLFLGPVLKYVRSFWIGTNQLGCDISVIKTSVWSQFLLNLGIVLPVVSTLLWLKPMADLFIRLPEKNSIDHGSTGWQWQRRSLFEGKDWAGSVGFSPETFQDLKFVGMILTGVIQLLLLRINVQAYLNLGVLAWYESLHGSKTPDAAALKHKILVVNHFMCRVAIQNLVPAVLLILFAGLSRSPSPSSNSPGGFGFVAQAAQFFAWWTLLSWSLLTSTVLAMFRFGMLLAY